VVLTPKPLALTVLTTVFGPAQESIPYVLISVFKL